MIPQQFGKVLYELTHDVEGKEREERIAAFVALVRSQQMTSKMDYILAAFESYAKKQQGITELTITSASELSDTVVSSIEKQFGDKVETTKKVDEAIMGGVVVKAGNTILDGSVKTQLEQMKRAL